VSADGHSVLLDLPSGNLHRILAIPRDSGDLQAAKTLLTLTLPAGFIDVGPDGTLYLDQVDRPAEVLRLPPSGGTPERVAAATAYTGGVPLQLPDGRVMFPSRLAGRYCLLAVAPGKDPAPLFDSQEPTTSPAVLLSERQIAFLAGVPGQQTIAIAPAAGGRIQRRLEDSKGADIQNLAAAPDGKTLYYAAGGDIWAIPTAGGKPRKIHAGNGVTVNQRSGELIIQMSGPQGARLMRVPPDGGPDRPIEYHGDVRLAPVQSLMGQAVSPDGKILVQATAPDSWFWPAAVLDPGTGKLQRVPFQLDADILGPVWTPDGRILVVATPLRSTLWRFRPTTAR
jgi:hypothetical protein